MNHNNITIRFHGMEQKKDLAHLKEYLESLLRHSPSNSTCHLNVFKEPQAYLCKLTVHSNIKTFSSYAKEGNIKDSVKTVLRNVKKQIASWKKSRSSLELTGVHSVTGLHLNLLDPASEETDVKEYYKKAA